MGWVNSDGLMDGIIWALFFMNECMEKASSLSLTTMEALLCTRATSEIIYLKEKGHLFSRTETHILVSSRLEFSMDSADLCLMLTLRLMKVISKITYLMGRANLVPLMLRFKAHFVRARCKAQARSITEMETLTPAQLSTRSVMGMEHTGMQTASK